MKLTAERLYRKLGNLTVKESRAFTIVCRDKNGNLKDATYKYHIDKKQIEILPEESYMETIYRKYSRN